MPKTNPTTTSPKTTAKSKPAAGKGINLMKELRHRCDIEEDPTGEKKKKDVDEKTPLFGSSNASMRTMQMLGAIEKTCNEYLSDLDTLARNIEVLSDEMKKTINPEDERLLVEEMQTCVGQSKGYIRKIKDVLIDLDNFSETQSNSGLSQHEQNYCTRILTECGRNMQKGVKRLLGAQHEFEECARVKMKTQVAFLYPDATDAEIETMTKEDPEALKMVLRQKLRENAGEREVEEELWALRDEEDALQELQASVLELNELFLYLGHLVDFQTEKLGTIEEAVDATDEYVEAGVIELEKAQKHQASYEAKRGWIKGLIFGCIIIGIIVLGVILFFTLQPCFAAGGASAGSCGSVSKGSANNGGATNGGGGGGGHGGESSFVQIGIGSYEIDLKSPSLSAVLKQFVKSTLFVNPDHQLLGLVYS